jgi:hypothetical protein
MRARSHPVLVISCHADTGFTAHSLSREAGGSAGASPSPGEGGTLHGHLDNFAGVYAVMRAYFSGRLTQDFLRIELTYGEEEDCAGAHRVLATLDEDDAVLVVDVTGTPTARDFFVEKCRDETLRRLLAVSLEGMAYDLYPECPDPVACEDEVDVYGRKCKRTCFLGVPCFGGDYNDGPVSCREASVGAVAEAICRVAEHFEAFARENGIRIR